MTHNQFPIKEVEAILNKFQNITILTHINPDADTIGTGLGIFNLLVKDRTKRIEIVNASNALPKYLDFLFGFAKIKYKMDFEDSLIISCDCGSLDRLGFNLDGREIINIDHHESNEYYGDINIVKPEYASASLVAYELFKELYTIDENSASCFYTGLLSDTRYFTTSSVNNEVFKVATELVGLGAKADYIAYNFTQRKSLSSLRILQKALSRLELHFDAKVATLFVTQDDVLEAGATMSDMEGIVDYAKSLVTVEIGVMAIEMRDEIRVSLRSKGTDISTLASEFGGGGHKVAAGFTVSKSDLQETIDILLKKIQKLGLLNGKIKI